ncbi:RNA polymerase sigma factor [Jiangella asiatica]|uniref:RNA polymerase sigma factor n=1 Tax=Jiangella asiatica TaxID=2530372 RepID=UPI001EEF8ADA|nr:sigma-70 family RNA polymerase sigma factor [Jiangella asiatica]
MTVPPHARSSAAVANAVAAERLRIVASLVRITGDWELAEDCVQDAAARALERWPDDGVPANPAAWLTTAARRRAVDVLRRRQTEREKLRELHALSELERDVTGDDVPGPYGDDRLRMLFACCHPALPMAGRVALTLKSVAGLSTREIARAFLVSEATMGQRLLRTRNKIAHAGIGFRVPEPHRLAERTASVLAVIYLVFNEGYAATEGERFRDDLATEAIQLTALVSELLPGDDEVHGLRALLLLQNSRRAARTDAVGDLVTMEEQDRGRWDGAQIAAGLESLAAARATGRPPGWYRLQAEIAALHATAASPADTDWVRIVMAYDALLALNPSPVVALNRAIAVGFRAGPEAGLAELSELETGGGLADYPLVPAVRADLLRRAGRYREAAAAYVVAIDAAGTEPERRLLRRRLREVGGADPAEPAR